MKIILTIILILIVAVAVFWFTLGVKDYGVKNYDAKDYKNISYEINGEEVILINGKSEKEAAPGAASKIITQYFGNELKNDFNNDGAEDIAFILVQNSGGTGTFYYLAVALKINNGYKGTNAVFIGDRIIPQAVEFKDKKIIVMYLDRKKDESFAETPSIATSISISIMIENGRLAEVR